MARYKIDNETLVDTDNATYSWKEKRDWDGHNQVGRSSGSQWGFQTMHRSRKGRYYIEHRSSVQGTPDYAEWVGARTAALWLMQNEYELPENLKGVASEVSE